jgi:glycosyltransferase involved in cell wall biosynthesis
LISGEEQASLARLRGLSVALVHDWLTGMRGGERCLEVFCEIFPRAPIYTLFHFPGSVSPLIESRQIRTSFIQALPRLRRWHRHYLPFFPRAMRGLDLSGHDLIVSLSHCVAKTARAPGARHVSYCFTPMRYLYDQKDLYFNRERWSAPALRAIEVVLGSLRRWDLARHPDRYIAISGFVAERIRGLYGMSADVIYPPVDTDRFRPAGSPGDYYLVVSSLAPYKRVDLAVQAMNRLGRRLIVVGKGEEERRIASMAGPTVELLGWRPDAEVTDLVAGCRAFIMPQEEDFGIAPLEAMACGRPVIALGRGGALETVVDIGDPSGRAPTGILFPEPTPERLAEAILAFEAREGDFDPAAIRRHAEEFSTPRFRARVIEALARFAG